MSVQKCSVPLRNGPERAVTFIANFIAAAVVVNGLSRRQRKAEIGSCSGSALKIF